MAYENKELFQQIADKAIEKYDFPVKVRAELMQFSENATYLLRNEDSGQELAVLRISRPGYHRIEELEAEIVWLQEIRQTTDLQVTEPIAGKNGEYIQRIVAADFKEYFCIMTKYLTGTAPEEENERGAKKQFTQLGEITAQLHRQTQMWNGAKNLQRVHWSYDNMIGATPVWGPWQAAADLTQDMIRTLTRTSQIIKKRLERLGKTKDNYGLIHADLRLANLLVEGEQMKIIDFDDCGFGWHLHDLASAVSFIETKPIIPELVEAWLKGYSKILPLNHKECQEIDTFIMQRRMQLMAWMASHSESMPVQKLNEGFTEGTVELAEKYLGKFDI